MVTRRHHLKDKIANILVARGEDTNVWLASRNLEIAEFYGNGATASAIEHRFRPLRAGAERLRVALREGKDPSDVNILDGSKGATRGMPPPPRFSFLFVKIVPCSHCFGRFVMIFSDSAGTC